ncbi:MAG: hypothetical protein F6K48_27135, partial [Okeania sp. SIO3H1]|nr:hypothetical protein [Okeania sp. SIO3H1]
GGQPFLTQKLCKIIVQNNDSRTPDVAELVQTYIINGWEFHDHPEHLRTIRDRLLINEKRASRLLGLYQQVLIPSDNGIIANDSPEAMELRLTGLVVKHEDQLQVTNYIYQQVFNLQWVEQELAKLRPYSEGFTAWQKSGYQDESRLLRGQTLADALVWARDKNLSVLDYRFLTASQELEKEAMVEINKTLEKAQWKAQRRLGIISFIALALLFVGAVIAGVRLWRENLKVAEAEAVQKSVTSQLLFESGQDFEALLQALRAVKQLPRPNLIFQLQDDSKMQITDFLRQLIYKYRIYRERNRLTKHEDDVSAVVFSPDGETIATASSDNSTSLRDKTVVKLWGRDGQLLQTLTGHQGYVSAIAFSPDGKIIATASLDNSTSLRDKTVVKLWGRDGQLLQTLTGHQGYVSAIAFSPDGEIIATASLDKTVKLWGRDGQLLQTLTEHQGGISAIAFSPDGEIIATASLDKTVKLWGRDGQLLQTLTGHQDGVSAIAFSPDGEIIATASLDKTVKLWGRDGQLLQTLTGHQGYVWAVAFSPDGETIATASSDKTVKLWGRDGKLLQTLTEHQGGVSAVAFSPNGDTIVITSWDKTVKLWGRDGKLLQTLTGHQGGVSAVAFSPNGDTIVITSWDKTVKLWGRDGKLLQTLTGYQGYVSAVAFSPDGETIATASSDKTVKLWGRDGKLLQTLTGHQGYVWEVAFSPDGETIATASSDKTVKLWNSWKFDRLHEWGCNWVRDYLENNPNVSESDKRLCDGVGDGKSEVKSK